MHDKSPDGTQIVRQQDIPVAYADSSIHSKVHSVWQSLTRPYADQQLLAVAIRDGSRQAAATDYPKQLSVTFIYYDVLGIVPLRPKRILWVDLIISFFIILSTFCTFLCTFLSLASNGNCNSNFELPSNSVFGFFSQITAAPFLHASKLKSRSTTSWVNLCRCRITFFITSLPGIVPNAGLKRWVGDVLSLLSHVAFAWCPRMGWNTDHHSVYHFSMS